MKKFARLAGIFTVALIGIFCAQEASAACDLNSGPVRTNSQKADGSGYWEASVSATKNACGATWRIHIKFSNTQWSADVCSGYGVSQNHGFGGEHDCWVEFGDSASSLTRIHRPGCGNGGTTTAWSDTYPRRTNTMGVAPCRSGRNPNYDGTNPWNQDCIPVWDPEFAHYECDTPLIVPTGPKHPFKMTSAADGVWFDIDADGVLDHIAWTQADDDSAFLAIDRNHNGVIDDASELFGNHTLAGRNNGFDALIGYSILLGGDTDGALLDLTSEHPLFSQLLLWQDSNHNGISEPYELRPFSDLYQSIALHYDYTDRTDHYGNLFGFKGDAVMKNGRTVKVFDVYFKTDDAAPVNTLAFALMQVPVQKARRREQNVN